MNNKANAQSLTYSFILTENIWLKTGILLTAFAVIHTGALLSLSEIWWNYEDSSHGFVVPIISLYLVWIKRKSLIALPVQQSFISGVGILTAGAILNALGRTGGILILQGISIIVMAIGIVLLLLGGDYLKALSLPLLYLIFMLPILNMFGGQSIHWPFQLLTAEMVSIMLSLFGIPVFRNIQYLELPGISLEVARFCSGVNYLTSVLSIAVPLTYLTQRQWTRRLLLMASGLIIGIMTNWLRVFLIAVWLHSGGEGTHGPFHILQGLFVSVAGFAFFFILAIFLAKKPFHPLSGPYDKSGAAANHTAFNIKHFNMAWFIAVAIISGIAIHSYLFNIKPAPLKAPLKDLPLNIGGWKGMDVDVHEISLRFKGADSEVIRTYTSPSGDKVGLYIGYFENQRQGKEIAQESFNSLYYDSSEISMPADKNKNILINKTIINEDKKKYMVLFWNDLNGNVVSNIYKSLFTTAINGVIHRRTNGAVIVVSASLNNPDGHQKALKDSIEFVNALMPALRRYLPGRDDL